MGQPKALLDWHGRHLVLAHCAALAEFADQIVVVEGAVSLAIVSQVQAAIVVRNEDWATSWPADSLRSALVAYPLASSALVTPVDVVPATPDTLRALLGGEAAVPIDSRGRPGHPVYLDRPLVAAVREEAPSGGLRAVLGDARRVSVADPLVATDFDDPVSYAKVRAAAIGR